MKDKRAAQIKAKAEHKAALKAAKAGRRGEPVLERAEPTRLKKPTILIVCEGENTEPSYFNQFRLTSARIKATGIGCNTVSLVDQAIALQQQGSFEQVWCVFDKDTFSARDFNAAIAKAESNGLRVAYSNQAFEYWLLLHFEDHQGGAMPRNQYEAKINSYIIPLGARYDGQGNKQVSVAFFDLLMGTDEPTRRSRVEQAIERAKRNYDQWTHHSPALEESTTKVFELVQEILKYA